MKLKITFAFFFLFVVVAFSQTKKPEFEFTLYGEDSRGHKDSVIIGYAHDANTEPYLDTVYGDKNIANNKFDSVFEMRVHKIHYLSSYLNSYSMFGVSKRITLGYYNTHSNVASCVPYGLSESGFVLMKIKYPPFKLTWDKRLFDKTNADSCVGQSFFLFEELTDYPPYPIFQPVFMQKNSILIDSVQLKVDKILSNTLIPYPDGTKDTLERNYLFRFVSNGLGSPTENLTEIISKVYPNPCQDQLNLFLPAVKASILMVNIYGTNGVLMSVAHIYANDIVSVETSTLSTGNYIVEAITDDNRRFIAKFIKIQ